MSLGEKISQIFTPYRLYIETLIDSSIAALGPKTALRDACEYALKTGGKRFRPAIVLMIAKALKKELDVSHAALAVEYFHTASLIADDLPCMDNDDERRNLPTVHKAFNESTALLATYALISAGYDRLRLNAQGNIEALALALENATHTTGILGATGGQFLDIHLVHPTEEQVLEVIEKKTGTLFELSFVLGWIYGGGDVKCLNLVKTAAHQFGMAFQIVDDFLDLAKDIDCGRLNYPALVGKEKGAETLKTTFALLKETLGKLQLDSLELSSLIAILEQSMHAYEISASSAISS